MNFHHYNSALKQKARLLRLNSTKAEIGLWTELLRKKKMGFTFNRQRPIDNFIIDFFCSKLKLIIEVDGWTHEDPDQQQKDLERQIKLSNLGYHIIRFTDREIFNDLDEVKSKLSIMIRDLESIKLK